MTIHLPASISPSSAGISHAALQALAAAQSPHRDPSLPTSGKPAAYVDVFVDDFIALAQEQSDSQRVRNILMHAIDDVFRPLATSDNIFSP